MKISKDMLEQYALVVNHNKARRLVYYNMYKMLYGGSFSLISEAIRREFKDPNAILELEGRLIAVNIFKKVVHKLAAVYVESPLRAPADENTSDEALLEDYEDAVKINIRQKQANRYLEAFQKNLKEFFTGKDGVPCIKNLPPHTYEVFNVDNPDKSMADIVCKVMVDDVDPSSSVFHWFSDESFWITDGIGTVIRNKMNDLKNPDGINPAGTLPFVYKCKSTDSVDPEIDDSLYRISIALPIVMSDLFFACKYQCWSMIYTIGVKGDINRNPSSIIQLDFSDNSINGNLQPVINSIKPTVDSDKVIAMVEATLHMFLSSVGLSAATLTLGEKGSARSLASGVSKMLDSAEVVEGKKDQQDDMIDDEHMTWMKFKALIPYWRRNQLLNVDFNQEFSQTFDISISFKDPKAMISETDALLVSASKIKQRLTTWTRELQAFYPDYGDEQIDQLKAEILQELQEYPEIYAAFSAMQPAPTIPGDNAASGASGAPPLTQQGNANGIQSKVPNQPGKKL